MKEEIDQHTDEDFSIWYKCYHRDRVLMELI